MHLTNLAIASLPLLASVATAFPSLSKRNSTYQPAPKGKSCVIPSGGSNATDDSDAIRQAFAECSQDATIIFDAGVDYYAMTPIRADNLSNVDILLKGNIHLPQNISTVQNIVNQTNGLWLSSVWFSLKGNDVGWYGTNNVSTGWIYAYGQDWWDRNVQLNVNGTGLPNRPHLASFNFTNGNVKGWKVRKPIAWNMQVSGNNITIKDTIIDAFTSGGFPFNTDGFDIGATNVVVDGFTIANGDDAVAIQTGASNVLVKNGFVSHHSHGLSIGSLGQNQAIFANVSNIHFDNIVMDGAVYAARFKSWIGGQGLAKNVTWSNFRLNNVTFPIFVTQTYFNQGSAQTQIQSGAVTGRPDNASVIMQDFTWENFTGNINFYNPGDRSCVTQPCWYDNGIDTRQNPGTQAIIFECSNATTCNNFVTKNIEVFPQPIEPSSVICINVGEQTNPGLGFQCAGGNYNGTLYPQ